MFAMHVESFWKESPSQSCGEAYEEAVPLPLQCAGLSSRVQIESEVTAHIASKAAILSSIPLSMS